LWQIRINLSPLNGRRHPKTEQRICHIDQVGNLPFCLTPLPLILPSRLLAEPDSHFKLLAHLGEPLKQHLEGKVQFCLHQLGKEIKVIHPLSPFIFIEIFFIIIVILATLTQLQFQCGLQKRLD
jgi:hypothetical protein